MTPTDRFLTVEHRREPMPRIVLRRTDATGGEPVALDAVWMLAVDAHGRRGIGGLPSGARRRIGLLAPRHMTLDRSDRE